MAFFKKGITIVQRLLDLEEKLEEEVATQQRETHALAKLQRNPVYAQNLVDLQYTIRSFEVGIRKRSARIADIRREIHQQRNNTDRDVQEIVARVEGNKAA
ncbi:MAG: hypothetical protein QF486_05790 [Candidatus Woesearchaeota archaeon]|jgi:hypothetical protein|nr:hypothetical protein [Candidatus Woesearchaeota archaeon]MDP7182210.1 hypothetical protein [Candidatus Woesearchaeota archaeon]MDP7199097.1 hypothetical protein [Candidatus Woesearchaeota archaeon]MDP7467807.1 hypothetical protein [Candidatus Woesearchaeota archaeon]MDP7647941.1 hypothetical protein [Candidatus Woesearchaeota archaeon]